MASYGAVSVIRSLALAISTSLLVLPISATTESMFPSKHTNISSIQDISPTLLVSLPNLVSNLSLPGLTSTRAEMQSKSSLSLPSTLSMSTMAGTVIDNTSTATLTPDSRSTISTANGQSQTHMVAVGAKSRLVFDPPFVNAPVGDVLEVTFHAINHTMTESTFDLPCTPLLRGFSSGFHQYNAPDADTMRVSFTVNSPLPQFFFCQQDLGVSHCAVGMVFALNPGVSYTTFLENAVQQGALPNLRSSQSVGTFNLNNGSSQLTTTVSALPQSFATIPDAVLATPSPSVSSSSDASGGELIVTPASLPITTFTPTSDATSLIESTTTPGLKGRAAVGVSKGAVVTVSVKTIIEMLLSMALGLLFM